MPGEALTRVQAGSGGGTCPTQRSAKAPRPQLWDPTATSSYPQTGITNKDMLHLPSRTLSTSLLAAAGMVLLFSATASGHDLGETSGDPSPTDTPGTSDQPTTRKAPVIRSRYGKVEMANWPSLIPAKVHARLEWVWPVAEAIGARIDIQEGGRVILLTSQERQSKIRRRASAIRRTVAAFDEILPWSAPTSVPTEAEHQVQAERLTYSEPEPVIVIACDEGDFELVRDTLAELNSKPERSDPYGCDDLDLFVSVFVEEPEGVTRWSSGNALTHHLTQALLAERFGRLPEWFCEGLACHMEQELTGRLSALPHRPKDLGRTTADGWSRELKARFKKDKDQPVNLVALARFRSLTWEETTLSEATGLVAFLATHHSDSFAPFTADLAMNVDIVCSGVQTDGSVNPLEGTYLTQTTQGELLASHFGATVLDECARSFRSGGRYRAPKK